MPKYISVRPWQYTHSITTTGRWHGLSQRKIYEVVAKRNPTFDHVYAQKSIERKRNTTKQGFILFHTDIAGICLALCSHLQIIVYIAIIWRFHLAYVNQKPKICGHVWNYSILATPDMCSLFSRRRRLLLTQVAVTFWACDVRDLNS